MQSHVKAVGVRMAQLAPIGTVVGVAAPWRSKPATPVICAVVDGVTVFAVSVSAGVVEAHHTATGSNAPEALGKVLAKFRPQDPVRVLMSSAGVSVSAFESTAGAAAQVAAEMVPKSYPFAYSCSGGQDNVGPGVVCAVSNANIEFTTPGREHQVAPALLLGSGLGQVVVYIGMSVTWMAVYSHGVALQGCVLGSGGLDGLLDSLGAQGAKKRVAAALAGSGTDPLASGEVSRWAARLAGEAANAASNWRSLGIVVPSTVTLIGPGAGSAKVAAAFAQAGLVTSRPDTSELSGVVAEERSNYVLAAAGAAYPHWQAPVLFSTPTPQVRTGGRGRVVALVGVSAAAVLVPSLLVAAYPVTNAVLAQRSLSQAASTAATNPSSAAALTAGLAGQVAVQLPTVPGQALAQLQSYAQSNSVQVNQVSVAGSQMSAVLSCAAGDVVTVSAGLPKSWRVRAVSVQGAQAQVEVEAYPVSVGKDTSWRG